MKWLSNQSMKESQYKAESWRKLAETASEERIRLAQ